MRLTAHPSGFSKGGEHFPRSTRRQLHGIGVIIGGALALGWGGASNAQTITAVSPAPTGSARRSETTDLAVGRDIVVVGSRAIIASLKDIPLEAAYDEDRLASYASSTIGEILAQINVENGDDRPALLVNGMPITSAAEIADFPIEAVKRIELLPRGAASRIGGRSGQRAYNIVLKPRVRSAALTGSTMIATEGGTATNRGDLSLTLIKGDSRLNATLRTSRTDPLFEVDRPLVPFPEPGAFSAVGNILPLKGNEIDPAFSALAGNIVGTIALPVGVARPTLLQLLPGANKTNPSNLVSFRTLRGGATTHEASVSASDTLTNWLTLSINGKFDWNDADSFNGLPTGRFLISAENLFTPFSQPVVLALSDAKRPLRNMSDSSGGSLSATLSAVEGEWRATMTGHVEKQNHTYSYDLLSSPPGGLIALDPTTDPFDERLSATIPVVAQVSRSATVTRELAIEAEGPILRVPAGSLILHLGAGVVSNELDAADPHGGSTFSRREENVSAGISVPLVGTRRKTVKGLGTVDLDLDVGRLNLGRFGRVDRYSAALNWQPRQWARLSLSHAEDGRAVLPDLLAAPSVTIVNVPYFDPVTDRTVLVSIIYGGAANPASERQKVDRASLTVRPWAKYGTLINIDYVANIVHNQSGALPFPTAAIVAAFPDRFVRDSSGQLVLVDSRTVNFARQSTSELRSALDLSVPLSARSTPLANPGPTHKPRPVIQLHLAYSHVFKYSTKIREGLESIDLLKGGAIGIGGERQRDSVDGSIALTQGGNGIRLSGVFRGPSHIIAGTAAAPDRIDFNSYAKFYLRAFVDLNSILPRSRLARNTRVTFAIDNLGGGRQSVVAEAGILPLNLQAIYRDPIGRTVSLELRKAL